MTQVLLKKKIKARNFYENCLAFYENFYQTTKTQCFCINNLILYYSARLETNSKNSNVHANYVEALDTVSIIKKTNEFKITGYKR